MPAEQLAEQLAALLAKSQTRIVFAESCTAGLVAATLAQVPGVSAWLCGSAVTYRDDTKRRWLSVDRETLAADTAVSRSVAEQMAAGVLRNTPEADLALSVTGHLGPDAPPNQDGLIFIGIARRSSGEAGEGMEVGAQEARLQCQGRVPRQSEATERVLGEAIAALSPRL